MNLRALSHAIAVTVLLAFLAASAFAQPTAFNYQGLLDENGEPANGNYDFEFELFDAAVAGSPVAAPLSVNGVQVSDGAFTVTLDFGNVFPGASRYLEVRVQPSGALQADSLTSHTTLSPRQLIATVPYAVRSISSGIADTAANADQLGGVAASQYVVTTDPRLSDARPPTSGSGDYIQNTTTPQSSSNFNISDEGKADIFDAGTEFRLGGQRFATEDVDANLVVGLAAGSSIGGGAGNSFFGSSAGSANTTGSDNSFFGFSSGVNTTEGAGNAFFGREAGAMNLLGSRNTFVGFGAGQTTTAGSFNSFFGYRAGTSSVTGNRNTVIGYEADVGAGDLEYATAIGANAFVTTSNTVVLGRPDGSDRVFIPGNLTLGGILTNGLPAGSPNYIQNTTTEQAGSDFHISGTGKALILDVVQQFQIGGQRVMAANGNQNIFAGFGAGQNTTASRNAFFGDFAGLTNSTGEDNTFLGNASGYNNITGSFNTFVGSMAGLNTALNSQNTFVGYRAGYDTSGNDNSYFGYMAGANGGSSTRNAYFGKSAGKDSTASDNSFFGYESGVAVTAGFGNSFYGSKSGRLTSTGIRNTFIGDSAGDSNVTGNHNVILGWGADLGASDLEHATAIGSGVVVNSSNTVVLGRNVDTVVIPGNLTLSGILTNGLPANSPNYIQNSTSPQASSDFNISGTGKADVLEVASQYNLNGQRILGVGSDSTILGIGAGASLVADGNWNSFFGTNAGASLTDGLLNSFFGSHSGENTTGQTPAAELGINLATGNAFFGAFTGQMNTDGYENTFVGANAGRYLNGSYNSFFGYEAGGSLTPAGSANSYVGVRSGSRAMGDGNAFFGVLSGSSFEGNGNSFFGTYSGNSPFTSGSYNSLFGYEAELGLTPNLTNASAFGAYAFVNASNSLVLGSINGVNNATSDTNVGIGTSTPSERLHVVGNVLFTGNLTVSGTLNAPVAAGSPNYIQNGTSQQSAADFNISGLGVANVFRASTHFEIGSDRVLYSASDNVSVGIGSGASLISGFANTFVGRDSGGSNTGGNSNTFIGYQSGDANTTGLGNVFVGADSGGANTSGNGNSFVGLRSGSANNGDGNSFLGSDAGLKNSTGSFNSFVGVESGHENIGGGFNAFSGYQSGYQSLGSNNAFFGAYAGNGNTTGANNSALGKGANVGSGALNFATAVGSDVIVTSSNRVQLGRDGQDYVRIGALFSPGVTPLCLSATKEISTCNNPFASEEAIARERDTNKEQTKEIEELKRTVGEQAATIEALLRIVCSLKPDSGVCGQ